MKKLTRRRKISLKNISLVIESPTANKPVERDRGLPRGLPEAPQIIRFSDRLVGTYVLRKNGVKSAIDSFINSNMCQKQT